METTDTPAVDRRLSRWSCRAVTHQDTGRFGAETRPAVDHRWQAQRGVPVGGAGPGGHLRRRARPCHAASAHYLRAPDRRARGDEIEPLRLGRSASQVRARMGQGGQACVEALFTLSHLEPGTSSPTGTVGCPG